MKRNLLRVLATGILAATMAAGLFTLCAGTVYAKDTDSTLTPSVYELSEDSAYEFTSAESTAGAQAAGILSISGEKYTAGKTGDITDFEVKKDYLDQAADYNLSLSYVYDDGLLTATDDSWHLDSDGSKKIDYISLGEKIGKGALVVQTSKDRAVWVTAYAVTNIFETDSTGKADFYQTTDVQLVEGCYYRVIVAYELSKKVGSSKILAWNKGEYETKKCVEVYEFHVYIPVT